MADDPPIDEAEFDSGMRAAVANLRPPPGASLWWLRGYALAQYHIRIGSGMVVIRGEPQYPPDRCRCGGSMRVVDLPDAVKPFHECTRCGERVAGPL